MATQSTASRSARGDGSGLRRAKLREVSSASAFKEVNLNDARAALRVWFETIGQERGYVLDSTVDILDTLAEIRARLESHSVELATLGALDYLRLESGGRLVPVLTESRGDQSGGLYSYLLLVNPASGAKTVADLRGRAALQSSRGGGNTGLAWLEVLLSKEKLGRAAAFFGSVKPAAKAQACILPVFFGTVDACVVDEVSLNLAKEMNPQLGSLRVLARSRPMIESVICTPVEPHPFQTELIDAMLSLHLHPRGRQLLMLFKTDRLVRIQPGELDSARELWRDYYRLIGTPLQLAADPGPALPSTSASRATESRRTTGGKEGH